jgi:hypothetical protein
MIELDFAGWDGQFYRAMQQTKLAGYYRMPVASG